MDTPELNMMECFDSLLFFDTENPLKSNFENSSNSTKSPLTKI